MCGMGHEPWCVRQAVRRGVPALHWMDTPAVADAMAPDLNRRSQGGTSLGGQHGVIQRNRRVDLRQMLAEIRNCSKPCDAWIQRHFF